MKCTHLNYCFNQNKAIVYKTTNEIFPKAKQMGISLSELEREAELAFVISYHSWASKKRTGSFQPFLKVCVSNRLKNYLRNEYRRTIKTDALTSTYCAILPWEGPSPSARLNYFDILDQLSQDSLEVVSTLLHAPEEMFKDLSNMNSVKLLRGALKRWLKNKGWEHHRIEAAFSEIRGVLL